MPMGKSKVPDANQNEPQNKEQRGLVRVVFLGTVVDCKRSNHNGDAQECEVGGERAKEA